jgi:hypothetical protein
LFSAAISYAVHSGRINQLPILHVASAVILILYNLHLAQPRKVLTPDASAASQLPASDASGYLITDIKTPALLASDQQRLITCRYCSEQVSLAMAGQHGKHYKQHGICVAG